MTKRTPAMKRLLLAVLLLPAIGFAGGTSAVAADSKKKPWSLKLEAGARYDDNISVEQLDVTTRAGDEAAIFDLSASYDAKVTKQTSVGVSYAFSQRLHEDFVDFDLQSHQFSAKIGTTAAGVKLNTSYSFYHTLLGGDSFLDMQVVSPSASKFITKSLFVRGAYSYFSKDFKIANDRDADTHTVSLDAFYFFNKSKSYVSAGVRYENENTVGDPFDYSAIVANAALQFPIPLGQDSGKIRLSYSYRDRDYDNITPSIGEKRVETRSVLKASLKAPIAGNFYALAEYKYADRNSNLASANYTENVGSIAIGYGF